MYPPEINRRLRESRVAIEHGSVTQRSGIQIGGGLKRTALEIERSRQRVEGVRRIGERKCQPQADRDQET